MVRGCAYGTIPRVALLLVLALPAPSRAFHSGGAGDCSGCHELHLPPTSGGDSAGGNPYFLKAADAGSTCLICHQERGQNLPKGHLVATAETDMPAGRPPVQLSPGGDFGWLKKSYFWNGSDGAPAGRSMGERHGHNIVAAVYGYTPDPIQSIAPGGSYPATKLSCISCHDPHGRFRRFADGSVGTEGAPIVSSGSYDNGVAPTPAAAVGVYRLLGGKGYAPFDVQYLPFESDPPSAITPSEYNREEGTRDVRVAYGSGMSEWCANCHPALLGGDGGPRVHPAGNRARMSAAVVANYNAYLSSGNMTGVRATAYTSLVPFEIGTNDYEVLKRTAAGQGQGSAGPDAEANVMCLSCHRAHASGWDHATRWNTTTEFLVFQGDYPGVEDAAVPLRISQGRTRAETRRTFGERPPTVYAAYQRSFCNKCHGRD